LGESEEESEGKGEGGGDKGVEDGESEKDVRGVGGDALERERWIECYYRWHREQVKFLKSQHVSKCAV